jgi:hypothetical protein
MICTRLEPGYFLAIPKFPFEFSPTVTPLDAPGPQIRLEQAFGLIPFLKSKKHLASRNKH